MDKLVVIKPDEDEIKIDGRQLHDFLEVGTAYKDWFPRMCEYGFTEGTDFCSFLSESTGGRPATNHILTLDMAKEIAMLQRNEKGKQARFFYSYINSICDSVNLSWCKCRLAVICSFFQFTFY